MGGAHISFDLWNTLITPNPLYKLSRNAVLADVLGVSQSSVSAAHYALKKHLDDMNDYGVSIGSRGCWSMLTCIIGVEVDEVKLFSQMQELAKEHPPLINDHLATWLNRLAENNEVYILSNTNMISGYTIREILNDRGLRLNYSRMFFSDEHLVAKPNVEFFRRMHMPHDGIRFHVGDNEWADGEGARRAGIQWVRVNSPLDTMNAVNRYLARAKETYIAA